MGKHSRVYACVDLDAIAYNMEQMKRNIGKNTQMIAVVKANGYGHGSIPISKMLEEYAYVWGFATATVEEALILRKNGITKPILLLGYTFEEDYETIIRNELRPAVFQIEMAKSLSEIAGRIEKKVYIHLAVDTGMTRIGFSDEESSVETIKEISHLPAIVTEGIFTHFARADEVSLEPAYHQLNRYSAFLEKLDMAQVRIPMRHCSNSAGILRMPKANMNLVRAGISIYGLYPSSDVPRDTVHLKPAMEIKSHISYIKKVPPGIPVSYGGTYTTKKDTVVATIPVGYADGYARGLSNKGYVLVRGKKAPILGRVCMDQFMVDVTHIDGACQLDEVTLLGKDKGLEIRMEELGDLSGRFPYEFACCIGARVPRVYRKGGRIIEEETN